MPVPAVLICGCLQMPPNTKLRNCDGKIVSINLGGAFCLDGTPRKPPAMPAGEQAAREKERLKERKKQKLPTVDIERNVRPDWDTVILQYRHDSIAHSYMLATRAITDAEWH